MTDPNDVSRRLPARDAIAADLDAGGIALIPGLLARDACASVSAMFDEPTRFRGTVDMARHGFGRGRYRYFSRPIPPAIQALREALYPPLAGIADTWAMRWGEDRRWPASLAALEAACAAAGQTRPTPLLLRYGPGDYNRLHQDLYGPLVFPLQVIVLLTCPGRDHEGGELVLVEQRPRMQSRPIVVPLAQGDAVVIPVRDRPFRSARGWSRLAMRHGVSEIRSGLRQTLGIVFHDAI
jgi:hypothetical protein